MLYVNWEYDGFTETIGAHMSSEQREVRALYAALVEIGGEK